MDKEKISQKDYELINSYLDQELDRKDVLKFAERMSEDPEISAEVADLMKVKAMVKEMPTVAPPRNYILTRAMAEEARPKPWWERLFPVFRTAAAFCALALVFTFLFPMFRQQRDQQTVPTESSYSQAVPAESMDMDYEEPVYMEKSLSLYDEEIVLDERDYAGSAQESYHAVMPSFGVMGGNPRIEYLMRQEENQKAMKAVPDNAPLAVPEGYISIEEASAAQRSLAIKIILSGGLLLSICALVLLHKRRKQMEL